MRMLRQLLYLSRANAAITDQENSIVVVIDHEVSTRKFPDWSMAVLYKLDIADRVEALLATSDRFSENLAFELMNELNPDSVMGSL